MTYSIKNADGSVQTFTFHEMVHFILDHPINERYAWVKELDASDRNLYYESAHEAQAVIENIKTMNQAIMNSKNTNAFVKEHCKRILKKEGSTIWDWDN